MLVLLRFCDTCIDFWFGPVVVLETLEVFVFPLKEGLGGDFCIRLSERLLVDIEVPFIETLVG